MNVKKILYHFWTTLYIHCFYVIYEGFVKFLFWRYKV